MSEDEVKKYIKKTMLADFKGRVVPGIIDRIEEWAECFYNI